MIYQAKEITSQKTLKYIIIKISCYSHKQVLVSSSHTTAFLRVIANHIFVFQVSWEKLGFHFSHSLFVIISLVLYT